MQPQIAKMPGRDRKPTLKACKIFIIQKKKKKKKEGAEEIFQRCSIREHFDAMFGLRPKL